MRKKVTVVGAGNVGASCALRIADKELADVVLVDIVEGVPQGKGLDLLQSGPVQGYDVNIIGSQRLRTDRQFRHRGDYRRLSAQARHEPRRPAAGQLQDGAGRPPSRPSKHSPNCILIVVTNPLDAMCQAAFMVSKFPQEPRDRHGRGAGFGALPHLHRAGAESLGGERDRGGDGRPWRHHGSAGAAEQRRRNSDHRADGQGRRSTAWSTRTRNGGAEIVKYLKTGSAFYAPSAAARRDGGVHSEGQEEGAALRRLPGRRVRDQRPVRGRAGEAGRSRASSRSTRSS